MRKRFLLISTIIVLSAFTFAACGKKSPSSPESTNLSTPTAAVLKMLSQDLRMPEPPLKKSARKRKKSEKRQSISVIK